MRRVAVIDMGTNTFHLLIAALKDDSREILVDEKWPVGLGKGGINSNQIKPDAMDRALSALHEFKRIADHHQVEKVLITGTSAIRSAENKDVFLARIKNELGWDVLIISGEQEAIWIYEGVKQAVNIPKENSLVVDVGGGSVEFIICNSEGIVWKQSFEIGGQRLMELFHLDDPIKASDVKKLEDYLTKALDPLWTAVLEHGPIPLLIGSSGSFDTLCDIFCAEHGVLLPPHQTYFELPVDGFQAIANEIISKTREQRLQIPGMISLRVDMIVVGSILIQVLIHKIDIRKLSVSFYALKEGLLQQVVKGNL